MFIEKINFSIAGINFSYQYYPHMNISENSAIFNFLLKSNGPIDVNNTIYVLPSSNIMNYVIKNGIFITDFCKSLSIGRTPCFVPVIPLGDWSA